MYTNEAHQLDLSNVAKEIYSLQINGNNKLEQHRIVVQ